MPEIVDKIKAYTPLNWAILGNPVNWAIVILMLAFAGLAVAYIFPHPASKTEPSK